MPRPRGRLRRTHILWIVLLTFACLGASLATVMGEECDWTGSGLRPTQGITPVYLRCSQGRVTWSYPRGALRVLLRLGSSGREFQGCIKSSASWAGARVFLEGKRSLIKLLDIEDNKKKVRCFHSRSGEAALYVEATGNAATFPKEVAELRYDLEALPRDGSAQECRPCLHEEMSHAFCTSDLVTRGIIRSVEAQEEMSLVTVKVTKHLRHSTFTENSIDSDGEDSGEAGVLQLTLPKHCGARHGVGEFVFMARRKLGDLAITCAPRLEDWVEAVRAAETSGNANCILTS